MKKIIFIFIFITSIFFSCKKNEEDRVPDVPVDIYLYTSDPRFSSLNPVGGWTYIDGGSRGIVVYRNSNDQFSAYDRHCTYEPSESCGTIEVESSNILAVDSCCGSKFLLTDGTVSNGPATLILKKYTTVFDGSKVHIYN